MRNAVSGATLFMTVLSSTCLASGLTATYDVASSPGYDRQCVNYQNPTDPNFRTGFCRERSMVQVGQSLESKTSCSINLPLLKAGPGDSGQTLRVQGDINSLFFEAKSIGLSTGYGTDRFSSVAVECDQSDIDGGYSFAVGSKVFNNGGDQFRFQLPKLD